MLFYTRSAAHLADAIGLPRTLYTIKQFSDGELYLKLDAPVAGQTVTVVTATNAPAEHMLELFFLLDALTRAQVSSINLLCTYFAYARQSIAYAGEELSAGFVADTLARFPVTKTVIIHAHAAEHLRKLIPFENKIDTDFFCSVAADYDIIAAPDQGVFAFAQDIAQRAGRKAVFLHKKRPEHDQVTIQALDGSVAGKRVLLIDDIIATGNTLIAAAKALKDAGATAVSAAASRS